jgi:tRNA uracil 4-sulfurtransferase
MECNYILLRYGEIFLKGKNRGTFERRLVQNIKKITKISSVQVLRGRMICPYFSENSCLKRVFGLTSYSPAIKVEKEIEVIKKSILELMKGKKGTFKVITKRSDKRFPIKSPDFNVQLGQYLENEVKELEFSFKDYDYEINVEINQEAAYLFLEKVTCLGGLPVGVEGEVGLIYENEASLVAGILMMRRGTNLKMFSLDEISSSNLELLQKFSSNKIIYEKIDSFNDLINNKLTLVSGQNFTNFKEYSGLEKDSDKKLIFRPLIAFSKEEIQEKLELFSGV